MTRIKHILDITHWRSAVLRAGLFFILWLVLSGGEWTSPLIGFAAALAVMGVSLVLSPPGNTRVRPLLLAAFAARLLRQSVVAGADVARRALDPRLPINPGLVSCPIRLPPGPAHNVFTTLMSLLPGTVPIGAERHGMLVVHCLDAGQPVAAQLAAEEARLVRAISRLPGHG